MKKIMFILGGFVGIFAAFCLMLLIVWVVLFDTNPTGIAIWAIMLGLMFFAYLVMSFAEIYGEGHK
jgi:hypothetical protein